MVHPQAAKGRGYVTFPRTAALLLAVLLMTGCGMDENTGRNPAHLLPSEIPNWRQIEDLSFAGISLSDYINGGAEAYFAYGFKRLAVRKFQNESGARVTVEIYEMDTPENAFGVYSTDSVGEHWALGEDSSFSHGLLRFWKGPYFVRILCFPYDSSSKAPIRDVGEKIANSITAESRRPRILGVLPAENVVPDSACYFHRQTSLNNIRFISDENLLNLGDETDALTWEQYVRNDPHNGRLRQIVIKYPSSSVAEAALSNIDNYILSRTSGEGSGDASSVKHTDETGCMIAKRSEAWLVVVLDAPSCEPAEDAAAQTLSALDQHS